MPTWAGIGPHPSHGNRRREVAGGRRSLEVGGHPGASDAEREALRLMARLLRQEAGISAAFVERVVLCAVVGAALEARRYIDDLDFEVLLFRISLESDALARAAARISRARAGVTRPAAT